MDPVLAELYTNILLVFAIVMLNRTKKTQKDIDALREAIERRERKEE